MNLPNLEDYRDRNGSLVEPATPADVQADIDWVEAGKDDVWFDRATEPRDPNGYVAQLQDERDRLFASGQVEYADQTQAELESLWSPQLEFDAEMEAS